MYPSPETKGEGYGKARVRGGENISALLTGLAFS